MSTDPSEAPSDESEEPTPVESTPSRRNQPNLRRERSAHDGVSAAEKVALRGEQVAGGHGVASAVPKGSSKKTHPDGHLAGSHPLCPKCRPVKINKGPFTG